MKKQSILVVVISIFVFILSAESFAQPGMKRSGGWGPGSKYNMMYDPKLLRLLVER